MSKKENAAVAAILADPANNNRTAEEVADLVISALDDLRSRTHRLAVVGQIAFPEAPDDLHTVVLGPYACRGLLDTRDKFTKALRAPSRARNAGQDLYTDPRYRLGRGRFMLAPAFTTPRQAWDFYRPAEPAVPRRFQWIAESIRRWEAGDRQNAGVKPVCHCGTHLDRVHQTSAGPALTGPCPVHPGG